MGVPYYVLLSRSEPQLLLLLLRERFQYRERRDHHPALLPRAARLSRRRHGCQHPLARVCLLPRVPLGYCGRGGRGLLLRLRLLPRLTALPPRPGRLLKTTPPIHAKGRPVIPGGPLLYAAHCSDGEQKETVCLVPVAGLIGQGHRVHPLRAGVEALGIGIPVTLIGQLYPKMLRQGDTGGGQVLLHCPLCPPGSVCGPKLG